MSALLSVKHAVSLMFLALRRMNLNPPIPRSYVYPSAALFAWLPCTELLFQACLLTSVYLGPDLGCYLRVHVRTCSYPISIDVWSILWICSLLYFARESSSAVKTLSPSHGASRGAFDSCDSTVDYITVFSGLWCIICTHIHPHGHTQNDHFQNMLYVHVDSVFSCISTTSVHIFPYAQVASQKWIQCHLYPVI
jgi:hypothetical protein